MVDSANPAHPESVGLPETTTSRRGDALRRDRWISAETAVQPPNPSRTATWVPVLLVVALGAFLRFYRIGAQPLWVDEATSLRFAQQSLAELWSWSTIVDPGNPPLYYSLLHGWVRFGDSEGALRVPVGAARGAHDPARVRARSDDPRPSARHRRRAVVRDLTVPGLVLAGGARVCAPHPRGDVGDVGRGLAPSRTRNDREACASSRMGLARLRGGDDDRAPRAQHRGVPADRSERVDAGLVVEARSRSLEGSCATGCWPSSRCCSCGAVGFRPPSAGGGWRGVRMDPSPDLRQRAERRLQRLRRRDPSDALPGGSGPHPRPCGLGSLELENRIAGGSRSSSSSASRRRSASCSSASGGRSS